MGFVIAQEADANARVTLGNSEARASVRDSERDNQTGSENATISESQRKENGTETEESRGIGEELNIQVRERIRLFKEGNYSGSQGEFLNVRVLSEDLRELRFDNESESVETDLNISLETDNKNETSLKVHLKNGSDIEVKIMPSTASERALARLRLKVCNESNNCTIRLKEVGVDNEQRVHYTVKADQDVRVLGFIRAKMHVESEVDANTGEVVSVKQPWWASLSAAQ